MIIDDVELKYSLKQMLKNENILLGCLKKYGKILEYASDKSKETKSVVFEAVKNDGWAIA
jgi:hypothetical protein